jgi:hypothetical protein
MPRYLAHGLRLGSALVLPELQSAPGGSDAEPVDVVVRLGRVEGVPAAIPPTGRRFVPAGGGVGFCWPETGVFVIRDGAEIVADPAPGADGTAVRTALLGPVLAVLLHQRGRLVLHASAVAGPHGAVAVAGDSGEGKSTTAAALHARGLALVADDVLSLEPDAAGGVTAYPGPPHVRLAPEVLGALDAGAPAVIAGRAPNGKQVWPGRAIGPRPTALPLAGLYVLEDGARTAVEPLLASAALFALLRHSYCAPLLDAPGRRAHFSACAEVARRVPVRRLVRPRALDALPALAALVLAQETVEPAGLGG